MSDEDESITLSWTPRPAELADAEWARNRIVGGSPLRSGLAVVFALVGAMGLLMMSPQMFILGFGSFGGATVLAFTGEPKRFVRRRWVKKVAGDPALEEPVEATLDPSCVRTVGERRSITRGWSSYASWSTTHDAVVLATGDTPQAELLVVPHRAMTRPGQLEATRSLAERQLGPALSTTARASRRRVWTWVARGLVVALFVVPLALAMNHTHAQGDEWLPFPSQTPPRVSFEGADFQRSGDVIPRPASAVGVAYTPGGGLIMEPWPRPPELTEIWVLNSRGAVFHYLRRPATEPG